MKRKMHRLIRKGHRYLGIILALQFLAWTVGGLYFSWTNIEKIRGDHIRKHEHSLFVGENWVPVSQIIRELEKTADAKEFSHIQLIDILGKPHYQIIYQAGQKEKIQLADAQTGTLRPPLREKEAIEVAKRSLKHQAEVKNTAYLTSANGHHEYREKPLPAYAITFGGKVNTSVYVSAEMGTVQSFRSNSWRAFDFLWMLHTMDYKNRDNFNNWLLRAFSLFGLATVLSGITLFILSSRRIRVNKKQGPG